MWLLCFELYELNLWIGIWWSCKYLLVGVFLLIVFVGEMWLVVIELLNLFIICKLFNGIIVFGFLDNFWKNDGFWMYVELGSKLYRGWSVILILFYNLLLLYMLLYFLINNLGVIILLMVFEIFLIDG